MNQNEHERSSRFLDFLLLSKSNLTLSQFFDRHSNGEQFNDGDMFVIEGQVSQEHLCRLNETLDFECTILVLKNGSKLLIIGNENHVSSRIKELFQLCADQITVNLHTHTRHDPLEYPSAGDFSNFEYPDIIYAVVTNGKILVYSIPPKLSDGDIRDIMISTVTSKLPEGYSDAFNLLTNDHNLFMKVFVSCLPKGCVTEEISDLLKKLNPN